MSKKKALSNWPLPFLGLIENKIFVHLPKRSKYLKADFFVISNLVLALDQNSESVCAIIDRFNRFMPSEGTDTLILTFTFIVGFFCQRKDILRHL